MVDANTLKQIKFKHAQTSKKHRKFGGKTVTELRKDRSLLEKLILVAKRESHQTLLAIWYTIQSCKFHYLANCASIGSCVRPQAKAIARFIFHTLPPPLPHMSEVDRLALWCYSNETIFTWSRIKDTDHFHLNYTVYKRYPDACNLPWPYYDKLEDWK